MSRLDIMTPSHAQTVIDGLYRDVERRIAASPPGLCPVELAKSFGENESASFINGILGKLARQ